MILVADASALIALAACDSPVFMGESLIQIVLELAGETAE